MSSKPIPLLEGLIEPQTDERTRLRREIDSLERELQVAKDEVAKAKAAAADAVQAIRALRKQTEGLFTALKMIHGEISRVDAGELEKERPAEKVTENNSKLEMMKRRLGGRQAEFIELLQHGEMTTAQLAAAAHCHHQTVATVIMKLKGAGLIQKNGNKFMLRDL